ncbi:MAG: hypothetical protein ACFFCM_18510 [Promethearchaeota archaeon]
MNEEDIFRISNETNIENWYESLKAYTMTTFFIPMSIELAKAFVHHYQQSKGEGKITSDEERLLTSIEIEIEDIIQSFKDLKHGLFVRLSTRSPKDSRIARKKSDQIFQEELKKGEGDENSRLIAIVKSSILGLKVISGKEAMELLLDSQRVYDDLINALQFSKKKGFTQKIFVREWIDIPIDMEFRGFVHKKNLNAISQYYHYLLFPNLPKQIPIIEKRIKAFYNSIKNKITLDSFIIDFAVLKDRVILIEFNPFFLGTDPCLFSWKTDRKIFEDGPFEFRIRTEPISKKDQFS